ncbi:geranylgeranyl transferase type 2 alpha [Niveomyces insectorum RCEF 264]|uniref:Geranylgeranyl transferase type-2 subunit alpha n=1 Tax=Niveomyces insectorum RCEF 264 TaxID=1081102 RepID=A0A167QU33_9HYPO|nr:geranylgeranyl transferase type 2 alpha [Niveomyces insectorum RCEF 264]
MSSHGVPRKPRTRTDEQKRLDTEKIRKYHELEEQLRSRTGYDQEVFQLTTRLLKLNPEYYTVWNVRRRCVLASLQPKARSSNLPTEGHTPRALDAAADDGIPKHDKNDDGDSNSRTHDQEESAAAHNLSVITTELHFTIPLLLEFPKCYWIWSYRLWTLQQAIERLETPAARRIWEDELALDSKMLTKDRRNFHAWGYRRQVVEQLESPVLCGGDDDNGAAAAGATAATAASRSLVEPEFAYTTKMVRRDLSNFSAWHNRSKLIPRLLDERGASDEARKAFFDEELGLVREALNVGPEDQSLWFYHQFLMLNLTDYTGRPTITPHLSQDERTTYIEQELEAIRELLLDYNDVKWIYEALLEYTIAAAKMVERPLRVDERVEAEGWLAKLRQLDPMRNGRWNDLELEHILGRRPPLEQESM